MCFLIFEWGSIAIFQKSLFFPHSEEMQGHFVDSIFIPLNWQFLNYSYFEKKKTKKPQAKTKPPSKPGKICAWFHNLLKEKFKFNLYI